MIITCCACEKTIEIADDTPSGQPVRCPYCGEKTIYSKPTRIALPTGAQRTPSALQPAAPNSPAEPAAKRAEIRVIREQKTTTGEINPSDQRKIHLVEERAQFYQGLRNAESRRKNLGKLTSAIMLLVLIIVGIATYVVYEQRKEAKARAALELAHQREIQRIEREAHAREMRLKAEAEEKARREAELAQEKARREAEERERAAKEAEQRANREAYRELVGLFEVGKLNFYIAAPTNALPEKADGLTYYLMPYSESESVAVRECVISNGIAQITRIEESGTRTVEDTATFMNALPRRDYLVATPEYVYFHTKRERNTIGDLPKDHVVNLTEEFFGDLATEIGKLKLDFDDLCFEVMFIPKNYKGVIITQTVDAGVDYSLEKVREAVEETFPLVTRRYGKTKVKKFKRTAVLWDGALIKKGIDGITYVPRVAPPAAHAGNRLSGHGSNWSYWYDTRDYERAQARAAHTREHWQALYDQAVAEDTAEREFNERERQQQTAHETAHERSEQQKYQKRIDKILEDGALHWRARLKWKQK